MVISNERVSDAFLAVNSCSPQFLSDKDYTMIRKDGRADYHILYITQGFCYSEIDGAVQKIGRGNLILYKPHERQRYSFLAKDCSISCYIHFSGSECELLLKKFGLDHRVSYVGKTNHTLNNLFTRLSEEFALKKPFYEEICAALLLQFLAEAGKRKRYIENKLEINSLKRMDVICKQMNAEYALNRSVAYYAQLCHLSVDRFTHAFKESTGLSPKSYMQKIKIRIAIEMLENTDLRISEIAEAVGISDSNYFSRIFKKYTGYSPTLFKS